MSVESKESQSNGVLPSPCLRAELDLERTANGSSFPKMLSSQPR